MTYEERIAAAQAKMESFKAKMASAAEKAKAARAMKKEEIAAAIAEINADLDELDAALAEDYAQFDAAVAEDYAKYDAAVAERVNAHFDDKAATVEGNINAAKENFRLAKEHSDSKIYAFKLKAQMKAEALKQNLADKRAEKDKAAMEQYIIDLLDYAECCQQVAFAAAIEADMTLLEAAEAAADYIEKYGEPEAPEAAAE